MSAPLARRPLHELLTFLAIDLGAESGRAMLGRLDAGALSLNEVCRFPNEPVRHHGSLQWDILRLWLEIRRGLERASDTPLESVGIDTWGCDYALLGEHGDLLENPYHYRDTRTDGIMEAVWQRVSREQIYAVTGIQFLTFNTLYQLYAACRATPKLIDAASRLGTIPDLLNYWMTGELAAEYTMATTTQFVEAKTRDVGDRPAVGAGHPDAPAAAARRAGHDHRPGAARTSAPRWPAHRWSRPRATTPGRRSRPCLPAAAPRSSARARGRSSARSCRRR